MLKNYKDFSIRFDKIIPKPLNDVQLEDNIFNNDFTFESGKWYQLIAPSGKGKSTVVGIITGTRGDFNGDLFIGEINAAKFKYKQWSEWRSYGCSAVFQDLLLFPQLSAFENILLPLEIQNADSSKRISNSEIELNKIKIKGWADKLDISNKLDQPIFKLSHGQMQRVAILRALNRKFKWLIMDEPFSHLDELNTSIATDLIINEAKSQNAGIIMTSLNSKDLMSGFELITI